MTNVIPILISIVFVSFAGYMLYLLISSGFERTEPEHRVRTDQRQSGYLPCPKDECATNVKTGQKTCPEKDGIIYYFQGDEVCNPRNSCTSNFTPYAVTSDGSTNFDGVCQDDECPCLSHMICSDYILSSFSVNGPLTLGRTSFPQIIYDQGPIIIDNPSTQFCLASSSWLPLSSPGCGFTDNLTVNDLKFCMGGQSGCGGYNASPCMKGVLAAVTNNVESVNSSNLLSQQYGCVAGEPCPCDRVALYDTQSKKIVCKNM